MLDARAVLDRNALSRICELHETQFGREFGLDKHLVDQREPEDYYFFQDNGSDILAVAHLDTVGPANSRACHYVDTEGGPVVYSRALDDRLGAYIILDMLPKLGVRFDVLLTVGEESGLSTAAFFEPPKKYKWMIEFDRGGTDVVLYQYDTPYLRKLVRDSGAHVGDGIFSDISYLGHLGISGLNWGVGYRDYHGPRAHAYLNDTCDMVDTFMDFHADNKHKHLPFTGRELFPEHHVIPDVDEPDYPAWWRENSASDEADECDPFFWSESALRHKY